MSSDAGFQAIARQRLRLGTPQEVNIRYHCSGVLVKNENGNFLKLIYETVENLIIDLIIEQKKDLLWISIRCDKYCGFAFFQRTITV